MVKQSSIPQSWVITTVGDVYDVIGGGTPSTSISDYWKGKIPWITSADIHGVRDIEVSRYVSEQGIKNSATNKVPPKTLLVVTRVGLGKIAIAECEMCFSQDLQGLVQSPDIVQPEYALYYLSYELQKLKFEGRGTTISGITKKQLKDAQFPLPPYNEQKRIVAKIEELFSELDDGIESLKTAREQLKVYRQAVLKHAFEGKLTAHWREQNKDKLESADQLLERINREREAHYQQQLGEWRVAFKKWETSRKEGKKPTKPRPPEKPDKPNSEHLQKMWTPPSSWQWLQIGDFAFVTKLAGFEYTDYVKYDETGDLPVIKAENAGSNGFKSTNYSRVHSYTVAHLKRSHLVGGELLVVFVGAGTGNVALVPKDQQFFLGPNIGMVRPESSAIDSRYVEFFLRSPMGKDMILAPVKAVTQPSISMGTIRQTPIIMPSLLEQREIVKRIMEILSITDHAEEEIEINLQKSEVLRQSILKKAFSGKLVAQDPNDESASVLLERIRAEKEAQETESKKPKAKRTAA